MKQTRLADQRQPIPGLEGNWLSLFYDFIGNIRIQSKDLAFDPDDPESGRLIPFQSQRMAMEHICGGLDQGIRWFVNLKARQLGITTIFLALDIFWMCMFPNLQGALITDDDANREKLRLLLTAMIASLPRRMRPKIVKHNRDMLVLKDGSVLDYLVAGRKRGKSSLGVSRAYNFVHATEVSRYGDPAGLDNLVAALSEIHPHRLYLFESTAHGYNHFNDMWVDSQADPHTRKAFFIGWWGKDTYRIERTDERFDYYMRDLEMSQEEIDTEKSKTRIVSEKYGFRIEPEQIAWFRWASRTQQNEEGSMEENYPWFEDEAFVLTGNSYFSVKHIDADLKYVIGRNEKGEPNVQYKGYRYKLGTDFFQTEIVGDDNQPAAAKPIEIVQVANPKQVELRVWQEPIEGGYYTIGVDPAHGNSEWKNNHAISVWRCFADCLEQVAEYATHEPETYQVAWVLAHLAGAYKNCIINYEITGPGNAIATELKRIRVMLQSKMYRPEVERLSLRNALATARWYLYSRPDSLAPGSARGWSTNASNKHVIFNNLRDSHSTRTLIIRSRKLLEEMNKTVQDGDEIGAKGRQRDDRVFASCLAHKAWVDSVRNNMIMKNLTRGVVLASEVERARLANDTFNGKLLRNFFAVKDAERKEARRVSKWGSERLAGRPR